MWAAVFTAQSEWKKRSLVIPVSQTDVLRTPEKYRGTNEKHLNDEFKPFFYFQYDFLTYPLFTKQH